MEIKERVARAIRHGRRANQTATTITDAVLRALAEAGPTDGMVATLSDALLDVGHLVSDSEARAALQAALKEMGAG